MFSSWNSSGFLTLRQDVFLVFLLVHEMKDHLITGDTSVLFLCPSLCLSVYVKLSRSQDQVQGMWLCVTVEVAFVLVGVIIEWREENMDFCDP